MNKSKNLEHNIRHGIYVVKRIIISSNEIYNRTALDCNLLMFDKCLSFVL